jgi:hypothetical protein
MVIVMVEEVLVHTLKIKRAGEIRNFQISLPSDASRIIGVEFGVISFFTAITGDYFDPGWWNFPPTNDYRFQLRTDRAIGELSLQTLGTENVFFRGEIKDGDNNLF